MLQILLFSFSGRGGAPYSGAATWPKGKGACLNLLSSGCKPLLLAFEPPMKAQKPCEPTFIGKLARLTLSG